VWRVWAIIPLVLFGIIGVQESFASTERGPDYRIMLTDAEGNLLSSVTIGIGKESFFEFRSQGFDNQGNPLEATISVVCGPNNVVLYNETKLLTISSPRIIIDSFIPAFSGHYTLRMMAEEIQPISTVFTILGNSENHCDSEFIKNLSPLKQIKHGIESTGISCKEGLVLIFKSTDNSPACVKPSTAERLIERGWISEIPDQTDEFISKIAMGRLISPFMFHVNNTQSDHMLTTSSISQPNSIPQVTIEKGGTITIPIEIKSWVHEGDNISLEFYTSFLSQISPDVVPPGIKITIEPQTIDLIPDETFTIHVTVNVALDTKDGLYKQNIVGKWNENDFLGTPITLKIGSGSKSFLTYSEVFD